MLILASKSPRRQEILRDAGFEFVVRPSEVEEIRGPDEPPQDYVQRLAKEKAGATPMGDGDVVLAADTVVVLRGEVLEKPADAADATRMLKLLSGKTHEVYTGICLRSASREIVDVARTKVHFVRMRPAEIRDYVASGEPMDKAGAYGIQGLASKFIRRVEGCYFNVVGLPVSLVYKHYERLSG
ncbi:MAG: Maf family protein [Bryobacteraceae bacterium]|nr:Maf family protein [Bryobacteraceae bacterium]